MYISYIRSLHYIFGGCKKKKTKNVKMIMLVFPATNERHIHGA